MSAKPRKRRYQSVASGKAEAIRKLAVLERQAIIDLLSDHESLTGKEICESLGIDATRLRGKIAWMMSQGEVRSDLVTRDSARPIAIYSLGVHERHTEITQRTVSKWKQEPIQHDDLHMAFFGAPTYKGNEA